MKQLTTFLIILLFSFKIQAQVYNNPIAGKQSHPELEIIRIETNNNETVITLKVTNKMNSGGWFCADRNIILKSSKGIEKYELIRTENIPTCPDKFEFSYTGQELEFKLYFPPISSKIKFLDLIEDCSNACFYFYGIILDNEHNEKIKAFEKGLEFYQNRDLTGAIPFFENVVKGNFTIESHIYGLSYYHLILIYNELGNNGLANEWYNKLLNSNIEDKQTFIKELEKFDIKKQDQN